MKKIAGIVGVVCVVVGGILLATGSAQAVAVVLLIVGLVGVAFTVGGAAGSSGP